MSKVKICLSKDPREIQEDELHQIPRPREIRVEVLHQIRLRIKDPEIYKVPHRLRQVNETAYEPSVISIGPYHHGKKHLKMMEDIKKSFFDENAGDSAKILRAFIKENEDRIRNCYDQTVELTSDEFVEIVVFDGFLIVQVFRGNFPPFVDGRRYIRNEIRYDLLLLENQLPFFVLRKFHEIMIQNEETTEEFTDLALKYLKHLIGDAKRVYEYSIPKHLLGLIHDSTRWFPSNGTKQEDKETKDQLKKAKCECVPCRRDQEETVKGESARGTEHSKRNENWWKKAKYLRKFIRCANAKRGKNAKGRKLIRCAGELEEAGISFEKRDEENDKFSALDIWLLWSS